MTHVLLFDSDCLACSSAARAVAEMGIGELELRSLSDPGIVARLREAGLEPPAGPALLSGEGLEARLTTGWAMRRRLARLLGWRRATRILGLVTIEVRARASRAGGTVTRRRVLGAGLAAAGGALVTALVPGAASAATVIPDASTVPDAPGRLIRPSRSLVRSAMASPSVRAAIQHWGPITPEWVVPGSPNVLMLSVDHVTNLWLFLDTSDFRRALATRQHPTAIQYFMADGRELGSVNLGGHGLVMHPARPRGIPLARVKLFIKCMGGTADAQCAMTCMGVTNPANPPAILFILFVQCLACAGPKGIQCAKLARLPLL